MENSHHLDLSTAKAEIFIDGLYLMSPTIKNMATAVCIALGIFSDSTNLIQSLPGLFRSLADIIQSDDNKKPVTQKYVIHFDFGSEILPSDAEPILQQFCNDSRDLDKDQFVLLEGHTDSLGGAKENYELAMGRAKKVARAIILRCNLSEHRIKAMSFASERPVSDNQTEAGRAKNRRVEITVVR